MSEITLPLKVRPIAGAICIEDASRRVVSYTYFRNADQLANSEHWNESQAREIATLIARLITDRNAGDQ